MTTRTLLRRSRTLFGSDAAFLTHDGIDVDTTQNYEIVRRRVFFDDVHLVTIHGERGIPYVVLTGLISLFLIGLAILIVSISTEAWPAALPFFGLGMISLVAFLVRVAMGRPVITIFGRRSKAVLRFGSLRKRRAREVYGQICAAVRRGQSAVPEAPATLPPDVAPPPL